MKIRVVKTASKARAVQVVRYQDNKRIGRLSVPLTPRTSVLGVNCPPHEGKRINRGLTILQKKSCTTGARDRVSNLIAALRKEYPQRTALMEELDRI